MSSSTVLVATRTALEDLIGQLEGDALGLDTEFLRERTYRAELCLLQIASTRGAFCVDPLALEDLGPLRQPFTAACSTLTVPAAVNGWRSGPRSSRARGSTQKA
ncbi:MAG: hypothetical protein EBY86_03480, partial [Acidimicrobiia bacterium]|nr:hypothetical protein [Acidimicrobiia bacterium]